MGREGRGVRGSLPPQFLLSFSTQPKIFVVTFLGVFPSLIQNKRERKGRKRKNKDRVTQGV